MRSVQNIKLSVFNIHMKHKNMIHKRRVRFWLKCSSNYFWYNKTTTTINSHCLATPNDNIMYVWWQTELLKHTCFVLAKIVSYLLFWVNLLKIIISILMKNYTILKNKVNISFSIFSSSSSSFTTVYESKPFQNH